MVRELIDTELEGVAGGKYDINIKAFQKNDVDQHATAKATRDGVANAFNFSGDLTNVISVG
jgi:hypothetical protein